MPTEHITNNEVTQTETKTKPLSFSEAVGNFRAALGKWFHTKEPQKQTGPAPVIDLELKKKTHRYDTPTDLKHSAIDDKEHYPNETLANLLYEKTGQQYTVVDDDVRIEKRNEAIKILEFDLSDLKIETISDKELATMLKKRFDQVIVIPDDYSIKVTTRSDAIDSLRKLIRRGIEKNSLAQAV